MHFALFLFLTFCKLFDIFWAGGEQVVCTGCTLVLLFALLVLDVCYQIVSYIDIYICINSAAHKTTTITSTSHWHLSFTLRRHCVLKNHWNNNINNCMCVWFCVRLYGCVCLCVLPCWRFLFCLFNGFRFALCFRFDIHSRTSFNSNCDRAFARESQVWAGIAIPLPLPLSYHISFGSKLIGSKLS